MSDLGQLGNIAKLSFTPEEAELYELSNLAGITWDRKVFKFVFLALFKPT